MPIIVGITTFGASSPEKPALMLNEPMSIIIVSVFSIFIFKLINYLHKFSFSLLKYINIKMSGKSPSKGGINTSILEGHVKDVITSAKTKI